MARFFFSILFSTVFIALHAQVAIQLGQQVSFGGNNQESAGKLVREENGDHLIIGTSRSSISGNKTTPNYGESDMWLIKTNASLVKQWELNFGGAEIEFPCSIVSDSAGNLYLASSSSSGISGNKSSPLLGGNDFWLVKLTLSGDLIWQKSIGTDNGDSFSNILEKDGFIYLVGSSFGDTSAYKTEFSRGSSDYWIIKLDTAGNRVWDKTLGSSAQELISSADASIIMENGEIIIAGSSFGGASGDISQSNFGMDDIWVVKLSENGQLLWEKLIGGSGFELRSVAYADDNSIILAVQSSSSVSGNKTVPPKGQIDCWLVELDHSGNILRQIVVGGDENDSPVSIFKDSHGNLIIGMVSVSGISGDKTESNRGNNDIWIVALDQSWNIVWQKTIGGSGSEVIREIIEIENNKYVVFGSHTNSTTPVDINAVNYGMSDYLVFELFTTVSIEESSSVLGIELFPNPSSGIVNIRTSQFGTYRLQVINASGQLLHDARFSETVYQYDFSGLASGMYVINIQTPNGKTASYKVLVDRDYK